MSVRGEMIDCIGLDGFVLIENNEIIGLGTYKFYENNICEIVSLDSKRENMGIGTAILKDIENVAIANNCRKMRLVTSNDNLRAFQFYQKRKYRLSKIYSGAMDLVRQQKTNVPKIGDNGIPLLDEIEFQKEL